MDTLIFKLLEQFHKGGNSFNGLTSNIYKFYPEIGLLAALNISKIDALRLDEPTTNHFIDAQIRKLMLGIDTVFSLYNYFINAEAEAFKKIHKFLLLINIQKGLQQVKVRQHDSLLVQSLTKLAVQEIEECINC